MSVILGDSESNDALCALEQYITSMSGGNRGRTVIPPQPFDLGSIASQLGSVFATPDAVASGSNVRRNDELLTERQKTASVDCGFQVASEATNELQQALR